MGYFEGPEFCSIEEYVAGVPRRVHESQVEVDELYTIMMRFSHGNSREAGKMPVRTLNMGYKSGVTIVRFAFLNPDLKPISEREHPLSNGMLLAEDLEIQSSDHFTYPFAQAYMKDYFDDAIGEFLVEAEFLSRSGSSSNTH